MEPSSSNSTSSSSSSSAPSMEDLTKLLRGKTDSQRLAGLLLVTKFCDKNDQQAILNVYRAVGSTFLRRLLLTGLGKGSSGTDSADREAYLKLAVTVLATFARVPEIAAADDIIAVIPLFLEFMSTEYDPSITEECFEFLYLVSTAHDRGVATLCQSGGIRVLAYQMPILPDGSHVMELSMRLVQLIITKQPAEDLYVKHALELSKMVAAIAKQFAVLQNALKFEALHLLSAILCSTYSEPLHAVLRSMLCDDWSVNIRTGVMDVLQNRVVPAEKLQALSVAECVLSIVGEEWLIGPLTLSGTPSSVPIDRCILLVLESSRVEIAVILNELAYLKYEATKSSPPNAETIQIKLRDLGVTFSLIERIIKLISELGENEESSATSMIAETTLTKIISGLNETVGVVLDYLQDAKEHTERKGNDLLASVRLVGSYLAEAPDACKEKVREILGYMLSVESEDESRPFSSICFLLPMLCQITMSDDGWKIFASTGAFGAVVECLISLIDASSSRKEDGSTTFLACDTILNFLLKAQEIHFSVDKTSSIKLLKALSHWAEDASEPSVVMMASTICSIILDSTSEAALLQRPDFNSGDLVVLSRVMRRSLVGYGQDLMSDSVGSEADLYQIVSSGYSSWADRFPNIKEVVEK